MAETLLSYRRGNDGFGHRARPPRAAATTWRSSNPMRRPARERASISNARRERAGDRSPLDHIRWRDAIGSYSASIAIEAVPERFDSRADFCRTRRSARTRRASRDEYFVALGCGTRRRRPHPERVVGLHFFNPAPRMSLVEVVASGRPASAAIERACAIVERSARPPCSRPTPRASSSIALRVLSICNRYERSNAGLRRRKSSTRSRAAPDSGWDRSS